MKTGMCIAICTVTGAALTLALLKVPKVRAAVLN